MIRRMRDSTTRFNEIEEAVYASEFTIDTLEAPHLSGPRARPFES